MTSDEGLPDGWVAYPEGDYAKVGHRPHLTAVASVSRATAGWWWWKLYRISSGTHDEILWELVDRKFSNPVDAMVYHELNPEGEP